MPTDKNNKIGNESQLQRNARVIMDRYYDGLASFISHFFEAGEDNECLYITLFVTRRCSCFAYMIYRINNKPTIPENNIILTNSALNNAINAIASRIIEKKRTHIRLVDDSVGYGRAIVNIISLFKSGLKVELEKRGIDNHDLSVNDIVDRFIGDSVSVHVFTKKNINTLYMTSNINHKEEKDESIVIGETPVKMTIAYNNGMPVEQNEWNEFSDRISNLINNTDIANAAYVFSAGTDDIPEQRDKEWTRITTEYRRHKETVFFRAFPSVDNPKIIASIRIFACSADVRYRVIPFVFFHSITERQIAELEDVIFKKYVKEVELEEYRKIATLRSRSEFITMFLSHSLLLEFYSKHIDCNKGVDELLYDFDNVKVGWTYTFINKELQKLGDMFNESRLRDASKWLKEDEVSQLTECSFDKIVFSTAFNVIRNDDFQSLELARKYVIDKCEHFIMYQASAIEKQMYDLVSNISVVSTWRSFKCDVERRYYLYDFLEGLKKPMLDMPEEIRHVADGFFVLAVLFQLMDIGIISIVNRDKSDDFYGIFDGDHEICQQVRFCEQALSIYPRKYHRYMKDLQELIDRMSLGVTDENAFKLILSYKVKPELIELVNKKETSLTRQDDDKNTIVDDLLFFAQMFWESKQKSDYWEFVERMDEYYVEEPEKGSKTGKLVPISNLDCA